MLVVLMNLIEETIEDIKNKNNIMKRIIRLTESDLTRIVRRVIMEETKEIKVGSEYEFTSQSEGGH
jgi:hypothetical protein